MRMLNSLSDRMVSMFAPKVAAQAAYCQWEACCDYKRRWYCCYSGTEKHCYCNTNTACY